MFSFFLPILEANLCASFILFYCAMSSYFIHVVIKLQAFHESCCYINVQMCVFIIGIMVADLFFLHVNVWNNWTSVWWLVFLFWQILSKVVEIKRQKLNSSPINPIVADSFILILLVLLNVSNHCGHLKVVLYHHSA